jgi:pimeloyl-ACP methyl ester carboxylesterase
MPNAERLDVPDMAHPVNMEAPEAFNAALVGFLGRHRPGG